jgi:hypothetical protein
MVYVLKENTVSFCTGETGFLNIIQKEFVLQSINRMLTEHPHEKRHSSLFMNNEEIQ